MQSNIAWSFVGNNASAGLAVANVSNLANGTVAFTHTVTAPPAAYGYALSCMVSPQECAKISVDIAARSMIFDNVEIPNTPGNDATGPIVVDGTLSWSP